MDKRILYILNNSSEGDIVEINKKQYTILQIEESQDTLQEKYNYEVLLRDSNENGFLIEYYLSYRFEYNSLNFVPWRKGMTPVNITEKTIVIYEYEEILKELANAE